MGTANPIPAGLHAITPYLAVKDANAAIVFYQQVFGATEIGRISMGNGLVGHAELEIGGSRFMLAEEMPAWGNQSPTTLGGSPVAMALYVADVDAVYQRALNAGAQAVEPVKDQFYGDRAGTLRDPFGHKWHILTHLEDVSFEEMQKRCDAMLSAAQKAPAP